MNTDRRQAIVRLQKAVASGCTDKDTYKDLGFAFSNIGDYDSAVGPLTRALSIGPDDININIELGRIFRRKGDYAESVKYLNNAMGLISETDEPFSKNIVVNEIEISQKKTILDSKPLGLWVTLTTKCNLRCLMCDVWKDEWDLPESAIHEIYRLLPYLKEVFWQGGEVFFSDTFGDLFEKASHYPNLRQNINTNGILIDEGWVRKLSRKNVSITFAIDGVTRNTYEGIRRGAEFGRLTENLGILNQYKCGYNKNAEPPEKMVTIMRFIVMKSNYHEIRDAVAFARKFGFDSLQLCPVEGTIISENIFMHHDPALSSRVRMLVDEAVEDAQESGFRLESNLPLSDGISGQPDRDDVESGDSICPEAKAQGAYCELPWRYLFIGRGGAVMPSCMCTKEVGNIHKNSLMEIWNGPEMQFYRRCISEGNFREACSHMPRNMRSRFELIKFDFSVKKSPLDVEGLKEVLKNNPDIEEAYILLGREYLRQRRADWAAEEFKKAATRFPSNFDAHFELGRLFRGKRDFDKAIKELKIASEINPSNSEIHLELGAVYCEKAELQKSEDELNVAFSLNPHNGRIHLELGRLFREKRDFDKAIEELKAAAGFGLENSEIHFELGRVYRESGNYGMSSKEFNKAMEVSADNPEIHLELWRLYEKEGKRDEALKEFNEYLVKSRLNEDGGF